MTKKSFIYWLIAVFVIVIGFIGCGPNIPILNESNNNSSTTMEQSSLKEETKINQDSSSKETSNKLSDNNSYSDIIGIETIEENQKGQYVKVNGFVTDISEGKGHTFFYLKDSNSGATIKTVLFRQENEKNTGRKELIKESITNNQPVTIEGKIDVYNNELEIIVKKVY